MSAAPTTAYAYDEVVVNGGRRIPVAESAIQHLVRRTWGLHIAFDDLAKGFKFRYAFPANQALRTNGDWVDRSTALTN